MNPPLKCVDILLKDSLPANGQLPAVIVAVGDDRFLRQETVNAIVKLAGIDQENTRAYDGDECKWIDVHDELATFSLFETTRRVCIVREGDALVKNSRSQLEKWCSSPAQDSLLLLLLNTFPATTKLYKILQQSGWHIDCSLASGKSKTASPADVRAWIQGWGAKRHQLKLTAAQSTLVLEAVGNDCGLLDNELAKLALYVEAGSKLSDDTIREHVGSWRTRTMWEIADAIADGRIADALDQLQHVFAAGEAPAAVVPQISWSLRRFGTAANLLLQAKRTGNNMPAKSAIGASGFWGRDIQLAEQRLRRMGLRRASSLLDWLLELDLKIKGSHSSPTRAIFALEELCLRLA